MSALGFSSGGDAEAAGVSPSPLNGHARGDGAHADALASSGPAGAAVAAVTAVGASPPPLFTQTNVRKPEYWQFARLIAPAARLPEGKKAWTTHDATGIWCLRCAKSLNYQKGSSQSIRYHMETRHFEELTSFRSQLQRAKTGGATASAITTGFKRKLDEAGEGGVSSLASMGSPPPVHSANTTPVKPLAPAGTHTTSFPALSPAPVAPQPPPATSESWSRNVERRGGFWGNAYWYDLQLQRRMPLAERTVSELVLALPPCDGKRVLDVCAGSGRASIALLEAYPTASVVLLDTSSERLSIASKRLASKGLTGQFETVARSVDALDASAPPLLPQPVDVVIGCLAFHVLVERPKHYAQDSVHSNGVTSVIEQYERVFRSIWNSLKPGGHIIFGDHVGQLPLFAQLQALARVGFVDVDCAWRQDDSFVAGARKP